MNIILFGFKGCGKTHFGKIFAQKMHRRFIDTDDLLTDLFQQETGQKLSPRELYVQEGSVVFRAWEKKALLTLQGVEEAVIALGGGAVLDPENVELLQKIGCLVYLSASSDVLRKRILQHEPPAFLKESNLEASFQETFQERKAIYESIRARKIDLGVLDEAGVLAALKTILLLEDPPNGF